MANPGNRVHVPLPEKQALDLLLKVKPTADMPRQGAHPAKPKGRDKTSK